MMMADKRLNLRVP